MRAQNTSAQNILIHLGDYIDRGSHSRQVIERLMAGLPGFNIINLRGNHEQMLLDFLHTPSPAKTKVWLNQGGWETAASYGIHYSWWEKMCYIPKHDALADAIPSSHLDWLKNLPFIERRERDGFVFVHAGINPKYKLAEQNNRTLIWIRKPFLKSQQNYGFRVVHGHTPSRRIDVTANRINLDPGLGRIRYMMCDHSTLQLFDITKKKIKRVYQAPLSN